MGRHGGQNDGHRPITVPPEEDEDDGYRLVSRISVHNFACHRHGPVEHGHDGGWPEHDSHVEGSAGWVTYEGRN